MHFLNKSRLFLLLIAISSLGLQACSGGGGGTPAPITPKNADPIGYYAGTFSYTAPAGQTETNVKAIVDSDKFLMVHINSDKTKNILYVGTFTEITATTFTASVKIYFGGAVLAQVATISNGGITEKGSLSGTLSGTGDYTSTSFSLSYDTTINGRSPLAAVNGEIWLTPTTAATGIALDLDSTTLGAFVFDSIALVDDSLKGCSLTSLPLTHVNSEQNGRIRKYTANIINSSSCTNFSSNFSLTGYITPFDNGANDNRYLWINYNDNNFFAAELVKQ